MPVVRNSIPYRKSLRLRQTDPKDYDSADGLWETYDEALLASSLTVTVKSESNEPPALLDPLVVPDSDESKHIPRPRNAFICFRSEYVKAEKDLAAKSKTLDQTALSCDAAEAWRKMSEAEKEPFRLIAADEKKAHALKYPDYRYAPGSANGVARKNKKPKAAAPRRASTASSDSSAVRSPRVSHTRPSQKQKQKYKTNPPAPRPSRRKSTLAIPRVSPPAASNPLAETLKPVVESPAPVAESPSPSPSPVRVESPSPAPAVEKDDIMPTIVSSPVRPSLHMARKPAQFGFKRDLSPTVIETLSFSPPTRSPSPSPSVDMATLSLNDCVAASPPRSPSPSPSPLRSPSPAVAPVPFEWDDWMYAPLEMNEDDIEFDTPPENFGFFHPWDSDAPSSNPAPPLLSTDSF